MSYMALYRKFRPDNFEDVKGQDAIVKTLKNQIVADRIGHAYLFCGTRGTGKTTVAKLFAKAVNCQHPIDGSPCGECETCRAIAAGASMNVIEIDAASNNGVDNVREIKENVEYRPTQGKYKVYIIDEVHMLSIGAFNALLKTLEEPPEYVIFILATTEAHKIPVTILSRCQRYDFKRITIDTIAARMRELVDKEGWDVEEQALRYLARMADGSMRDGLSLLDQCAAFHIGERLTYDHVLEVLGTVDTDLFSRLLRELLAMDVRAVIKTVDDLVMQGRELTQMVSDFIWYLRNLLLVRNADGMEEVLDMSTENLARLKEEAQMVDNPTLMRYIREMSELSERMKNASQKRVHLEVALIKLCRPQMEVDQEAILGRIRAIEKQLEKGIVLQEGQVNPAPVSSPSKEPAKRAEYPKAVKKDIEEAASRFRAIMSQADDGYVRRIMDDVRPSVDPTGNILLLVGEKQTAKNFLKDQTRLEKVKKILTESLGKEIDIQVGDLEEGQAFEEQFVDIEDVVKMQLTIENE